VIFKGSYIEKLNREIKKGAAIRCKKLTAPENLILSENSSEFTLD
jgi:hypothetical protein